MVVRIPVRLLNRVVKPSRYTGGECNSISKDPAAVDIRWALCLPDVYEVGMSNLGLKILYEVLNRRPDVAAERVFAPWPDMEAELRTSSLPLCSLETQTPIVEFDIIGVSLQYEMTYTNILTVLDLGGIPLLAGERGETHPFVVGGGPCAFNPEPVADFFDFFLLGEGEESIVEVTDVLIHWKKSGCAGGRLGFLNLVARIGGVYVPSLYKPEYDEADRFMAIKYIGQGEAPLLAKRVIADLDAAPFPTSPVVPYLEMVHDRIMLEVFRGCTRGCRFCQAGVIYRPVRERKPETLLRQAQELVDRTGYSEISLTSLSTADYSCLQGLVSQLLETFGPQKVSLSLPSLRVDSFSVELAKEVQKVRRSGLTFAPEAGTQRLRDVINKGVTEENLFEAVGSAFHAGWTGIKLYFMIGLPTETDEDIRGIADLANRMLGLFRSIRGRGGAKITVSISTFIPKPHTAFQWFGQIPMAEMKRRQDLLKSLVRNRDISLNWHDAETSWLEGVFARGDRRLSAALLAAWQRGARFEGWSEHFHIDIWQEAFAATQIDADVYAVRERQLEEPLPWDHILSGVETSYLKGEWQRALQSEPTGDCRRGECDVCGVCPSLGVSVVDWEKEGRKR